MDNDLQELLNQIKQLKADNSTLHKVVDNLIRERDRLEVQVSILTEKIGELDERETHSSLS